MYTGSISLMVTEKVIMHIIVMSMSFKQTTLDGQQILLILKFLHPEVCLVVLCADVHYFCL